MRFMANEAIAWKWRSACGKKKLIPRAHYASIDVDRRASIH